MEKFYSVLKETNSFKEFIDSCVKQIAENDYIDLRNKCITEAFGTYVPKNVSDALVYYRPKQNAFLQIIEDSGIRIRWNSEFEDRLRDYIKEQGPEPNTPFTRLEWYSQKRKELEDIMTREDQDVGC